MLQFAEAHGHTELAAYLGGLRRDTPLLLQAAFKGDAAAVTRLLAQPHRSELVLSRDTGNWATPLHFACKASSVEVQVHLDAFG